MENISGPAGWLPGSGGMPGNGRCSDRWTSLCSASACDTLQWCQRSTKPGSKQWNHCAPAFHVGLSAVEACVHEGEDRTKEDTREVLSGWVGGNFFTHVVPVLDVIIQN